MVPPSRRARCQRVCQPGRMASGVDRVDDSFQRAHDEWVVQGADGQNPLSLKVPRQSELSEQQHEVHLGDSLISMCSTSRGGGVVGRSGGGRGGGGGVGGGGGQWEWGGLGGGGWGGGRVWSSTSGRCPAARRPIVEVDRLPRRLLERVDDVPVVAVSPAPAAARPRDDPARSSSSWRRGPARRRRTARPHREPGRTSAQRIVWPTHCRSKRSDPGHSVDLRLAREPFRVTGWPASPMSRNSAERKRPNGTSSTVDYVTQTISGEALPAATEPVATGDAVFSPRRADFVLDACR